MRLLFKSLLVFKCFLILMLNIRCSKLSRFKNVTVQANGKISLNDDFFESSKNWRFLIAVNIKDNSYSLPTFLATLEEIECPNEKKKCDLW